MTPQELYLILKYIVYAVSAIAGVIVMLAYIEFKTWKIFVRILSSHQGKFIELEDKARIFYDRKTKKSMLKLKKGTVKGKDDVSKDLPLSYFNNAVAKPTKMGFLRYSLTLGSPEPGIYFPMSFDIDNNQIKTSAEESDMRSFFMNIYQTRILHYMQPKISPAMMGLMSFIVGIIMAIVLQKVSMTGVIQKLGEQTGAINGLVAKLDTIIPMATKATSVVPPT